MFRVFVALLVIVAPVFAAPPAHAVIYDALAYVDSLDEEGFFGNLGIRGGLKTGNTEERRLAGQTALGYQADAHTMFFTASGQYARTRDTTFVENSLQHLRYRYMFAEHWGTEAFVQNEQDRFRRIALRSLVGAGLRYELKYERGQLAVGSALMVERMIITSGEADEDETSLRLSNYVSLDAYLSATSRFRLSGYLQPKVTDVADTRLSARASLRTNITERFFMEVFSGVHYDTTPAQTVEPLDTSSGFSIGFDFRSRQHVLGEDMIAEPAADEEPDDAPGDESDKGEENEEESSPEAQDGTSPL